jgi:hypothetical protein
MAIPLLECAGICGSHVACGYVGQPIFTLRLVAVMLVTETGGG